ncbi:MAG: hypothetical protein OJF59_002846 [Cytophagales bacterium]|nr:MAG: hypothetical protein OJF59_002846 [Cytophagales bacterium]
MLSFYVTANGLRVGAGGDFYHYLSYEDEQLKFKKNCLTAICLSPYAKWFILYKFVGSQSERQVLNIQRIAHQKQKT